MLNPRTLAAGGLPVYGVTQAPGELVVTWPGTYHAAVFLGLGLAEAVALAPPQWALHAAAAAARYRLFKRPPVRARV